MKSVAIPQAHFTSLCSNNSLNPFSFSFMLAYFSAPLRLPKQCLGVAMQRNPTPERDTVLLGGGEGELNRDQATPMEGIKKLQGA